MKNGSSPREPLLEVCNVLFRLREEGLHVAIEEVGGDAF